MSGRSMTDSQARDPGEELESWIESARRGDALALGQALQSFRDYLLLMAGQELDPDLSVKGSASDLVQETFVRAHRRFGGFRGRSEAEWRGWLRSILINSIAEHRRRYCLTESRRIRGEISIDPQDVPIAIDDETPSRSLVRHESEEAVVSALARLPEDYRAVVIARNRDKLTYQQIGERRGISAEAARKLWERAIGRLRHELGPDHDGR